ncbi:hypothetical protein HDV03_004202 [Kappamyces sp. JEL0829]|nr:hypothetical protein HDV03_004202 [Kappamyces sp. JEL0829]
MKKNTNVKPLKYWSVVALSCRVTQQISVVLLFIALYLHLSTSEIDHVAVTGVALAVSLTLYAIYTLLQPRRQASIGSTLASSFLFCAVLLFLTPILKNLTADISTDSIWALTVLMLLANLLFHNYDSNLDSHTK